MSRGIVSGSRPSYPHPDTARKSLDDENRESLLFFRIKKEKRNGETGANNTKNVFKIIILEHCSDWTHLMIIQRKTAVLHFAFSFSRSKLPEIKKERIKRFSKPPKLPRKLQQKQLLQEKWVAAVAANAD